MPSSTEELRTKYLIMSNSGFCPQCDPRDSHCSQISTRICGGNSWRTSCQKKTSCAIESSKAGRKCWHPAGTRASNMNSS